MALYCVKLTYSTARRIEQHEEEVDAANAGAAETAAAALIAAKAPHLATFSMTSVSGLKVVTAI